MKTNEITLGGISVALTIIILYLATILQVSTISILTVASAIVPICIIRSNVKTATFVFIASSIVSFFIVSINIWLLYTLIFGGYGIVKYLVERIRRDTLEVILKFIYFNIIFAISIILSKAVLGNDIFKVANDMISKYIELDGNIIIAIVFWIAAQIVFFIYDYALTLIITFYIERIHKKY